jgi:hypothetical protein
MFLLYFMILTFELGPDRKHESNVKISPLGYQETKQISRFALLQEGIKALRQDSSHRHKGAQILPRSDV